MGVQIEKLSAAARDRFDIGDAIERRINAARLEQRSLALQRSIDVAANHEDSIAIIARADAFYSWVVDGAID